MMPQATGRNKRVSEGHAAAKRKNGPNHAGVLCAEGSRPVIVAGISDALITGKGKRASGCAALGGCIRAAA